MFGLKESAPLASGMYKFPDEVLKSLRENRLEILDMGALGFKGLATLSGDESSVWSLAVLPDGRLASGSLDMTIRLWNVESGSCEATLSGHKGLVTSLTVLPDGRLASGSWDHTIRLWNVSSGSCEATLSGYDGKMDTPAVLPDGRLALAADDHTIRLWNVSSGSCEAALSGHWSDVLSLAVLPDGRLASGSADRTIRLWDVSSGSCEATLSGHEDYVSTLTVLPDGRLASGSWDHTIRLWNVSSGRCEATLSGCRSWVLSLTVLPDGRLASGSDDDGTIRLWNVSSGRCEATLSGHGGRAYSLAVLADGRLASPAIGDVVKSGAKKSCIQLWPIAPDKFFFTNLQDALSANNTLKKIIWSGTESLFNDEQHAWLKALLARNRASKIAPSILPATPKEPVKAAGGAGVDASLIDELAKLKAQLAAKDLEVANAKAEQARLAKLAESKAKPVTTSAFCIIPYKDLAFGEKLGEGSFGIVYKGKWNAESVALKALLVTDLSKEDEAAFRGEALLQAGLHHDNIVELKGICIERAKYTLVMELMPKGSLYAVLKSGVDLPWSLRMSIAKDIVNGLSFLHGHGILHRDLKSPNVLLDERMRAKLADFGYTDVKTESVLLTASAAVGSKLWMAPELFKRGSKYTEQSDLFALGVIYWELAARKLPLIAEAGSLDRVVEWVKDGERDTIPAATPPKLASLIGRCWAQRVADRPASAKVVLDELLAETVGGGASVVART